MAQLEAVSALVLVWYAMVTLTGEQAARKRFPKNLMEVKSMARQTAAGLVVGGREQIHMAFAVA